MAVTSDSNIFYWSLQLNKIHKDLEDSELNTALTKRDKSFASEYRFIILTSFAGNILEISRDKLLKILEENYKVSDIHHGFQK